MAASSHASSRHRRTLCITALLPLRMSAAAAGYCSRRTTVINKIYRDLLHRQFYCRLLASCWPVQLAQLLARRTARRLYKVCSSKLHWEVLQWRLRRLRTPLTLYCSHVTATWHRVAVTWLFLIPFKNKSRVRRCLCK